MAGLERLDGAVGRVFREWASTESQRTQMCLLLALTTSQRRPRCASNHRCSFYWGILRQKFWRRRICHVVVLPSFQDRRSSNCARLTLRFQDISVCTINYYLFSHESSRTSATSRLWRDQQDRGDWRTASAQYNPLPTFHVRPTIHGEIQISKKANTPIQYRQQIVKWMAAIRRNCKIPPIHSAVCWCVWRLQREREREVARPPLLDRVFQLPLTQIHLRTSPSPSSISELSNER